MQRHHVLNSVAIISCFWLVQVKLCLGVTDTTEKGILRESELVSSQGRLQTYHHLRAVAVAVIAMEDEILS